MAYSWGARGKWISQAICRPFSSIVMFISRVVKAWRVKAFNDLLRRRQSLHQTWWWFYRWNSRDAISLSNSYNYLINGLPINSMMTQRKRLIFHVRLFDNCVTSTPAKGSNSKHSRSLDYRSRGELETGSKLMIMAGLCHYPIEILSLPRRCPTDTHSTPTSDFLTFLP